MPTSCSYILKESEPKVHVTAAAFGHLDYLANLQEVAGSSNIDVVVIGDVRAPGSSPFEDLAAHLPIESPVDADPEAPALIGWTSGTTANPKGVVHSHQSVLAEVMQLGATSAPTCGRPCWPTRSAMPSACSGRS